MNLIALPLVIPLACAAACLLARRWLALQRGIAIAGSVALVVIAAVLVALAARHGTLDLALGGWPAGAAIRLRADLLGAVMVLTAAVLGLACAIYALADVPRGHGAHGAWPVWMLLMTGVCGALLTADLFNLFVWFEVMLIASFVLLALGGRPGQLRGGLVYVLLNLVSSTLLLIAVGLTYAAVRTLDLDELGARLADLAVTHPRRVLAIEALLLTSFGVKAAVFPLFFWLPASYPEPPPAISALFGGLLTKVGVYALIRVGAGVFPSPDVLYAALVAIGAATMLVGVAGALAQDQVRRILLFHIISQIGYMVAGLALVGAAGGSPRFALAATIVFVVHNMIVKTNLLLVAATVRRLRGTEALAQLGGVARTHPALALAFLVSALALAGMPPLSGFWAKLAVIEASLAADRWTLAAVMVGTSLLTLLSMLKIWNGVFAGAPPREPPAALGAGERALRNGPVIALALIALAIGLVPGPVFAAALGAADHLLGGAP